MTDADTLAERHTREPDTLTCPVADCADTWPDTFGPAGGRRERFIHLYRDHDLRGLPFKQLQ